MHIIETNVEGKHSSVLTQNITWKTHNGGKNHDSPQAVNNHYLREEYNDTENTEATSCLLLRHTRRRLHSGGNDLSLCLSRALSNFYKVILTTTYRNMCPKSYLYIYDFSAYLHMCPSNRSEPIGIGSEISRFSVSSIRRDTLVLEIYFVNTSLLAMKIYQ